MIVDPSLRHTQAHTEARTRAPGTTVPGTTRRTVLRTLAAGAGATAAGSVAVACGAGGEAQPMRKERAAPYSVRFMALGANPWMLEQLERYNKEVGPALKVQVAPEPQPDQATLFAKFQSTVAAGDAPDVARLKEIWVFEMFLKGAMAPLDGYFKTDKDFDAPDLLPLYQDNFKFKGQHYAIAREVSIIVGYYNKELFKQSGLDPEMPPSTYDQFSEYARKTTKAGATPQDTVWGFDPYEYGTREFVFLWPFLHMKRFGADFWNKEKTGIVLNTPAHVEALQLFVDMIHKDRSAVPPGVGVPQSSAGAASGRP